MILTPDNAIGIRQGCYGLTDALHQRPVIATVSASEDCCSILCAYLPLAKTAALTHYDPLIQNKGRNAWYHLFFGDLMHNQCLDQNVFVYLRGGGDYEHILKTLQSEKIGQYCPNLTIISHYKHKDIADFAIDTRTGDTFENFNDLKFDEDRLFHTRRGYEHQEKLYCESSKLFNQASHPFRPLFLEYDGRVSSNLKIKNEYCEFIPE